MDMKKFFSVCLQGNIYKSIEYLKTIDNKDNDILLLEKQYEERFLTDNEIYEIDSADSWVRNVVNCYICYFRAVLTNKPTEEAENSLIACLSKLVRLEQNANLDEIESELEKIFKEKGYSFLGGVTPPYRGPYIWKTTSKKEFNVELLHNSQVVTVYFISDFLLLSWIHYATMGKHHSGGWAKPEGLYYVDSSSKPIDTDSAEFQIWFLKHEAQHLSDYKQFPNLNARNLEYRAKLIELIYSPQLYALIEKFLNQSKNDKALPHPYASYTIVQQLSTSIFGQEYIDNLQQWKNVKADIISKAATALFLQNNKELYEAGKETEGII